MVRVNVQREITNIPLLWNRTKSARLYFKQLMYVLPFGSFWRFSMSHTNNLAKWQLQNQGLPSRRSIRREDRDSRTLTSSCVRPFFSSSSSLKEVNPVKASLPTMFRWGLFPSRSLIKLLDSPNVPEGISVKLLLPKSKKTNLEEVLRVPGSSCESELFLRSR